MSALRCFEVIGWWPPKYEEGPNGTKKCIHGQRHVGAFVVAQDALGAVMAFERTYPEVRVDSCVLKGAREVIIA